MTGKCRWLNNIRSQFVYKKISVAGATLTLILASISSELTLASTPAELQSIEFEMWIAADDAQGQIINGVTPADPAKWKSIFLSKQDGKWCTAFAVGPHTIMTAAHCIPTSKQITVKRPTKQDSLAACVIPSSYPTDVTLDYAVCIIKEDFMIGPFETLNRDSGRLKTGASVVLTGYGCRNFANQNEKDFSIGNVSYIGKSGGNYGILSGPASVCFGDSGGPAFIADGNNIDNRLIIGLNSQLWTDGATSIISLIPSSDESFFTKLSDDGVIICGVTPTAKNCRHE